MQSTQSPSFNKLQIFLPGVAAVLTLAVFSSVAMDLLQGWLTPVEETQHSLLALAVLTLLLWKAPGHLVKPIQPDAPAWIRQSGMGFLLAGLLMLFGAQALDITFLKQAAFVVTGWGLVGVYLEKRPTGYGFLLSLFIIQAVPLLIVTPLTIPLKVWATQLSAGLATALGWPVTYTQNLIEVNGLAMQVTSPCSGMHSIVGLTFVWLLSSVVHSLRLVKVLLGFPVVWGVAILLNALRLFLTISWALWINPDTAIAGHTWIGYLTFALGIVLLIALGRRMAAS